MLTCLQSVVEPSGASLVSAQSWASAQSNNSKFDLLVETLHHSETLGSSTWTLGSDVSELSLSTGGGWMSTRNSVEMVRALLV